MISFSYNHVGFWSFILVYLVCFFGCNNNGVVCSIDSHKENPNLCSDQYTFDENKKAIERSNGICDKADLLSLSDVEDYYYLNLLSVSTKNNKRVVNSNYKKIEFEESSSGVKIPYEKIKHMISFTSSSKNGDQVFEIINGDIIAPCFDDSDTVDVKVEWTITKNKEKFHNSVSSKSSIVLSFVSNNRRSHGKASCYSLPYILNVYQPNLRSQICDIKVELEGVTDAEFKNSNLEISLIDSLSGFVSSNYFKWNDVKDQLKTQNFIKNVWVRVKGKPNTLRPYINNGDVYSGTCKPISQSIIEIRKSEIKHIFKNFFGTTDEDEREAVLDELLLFSANQLAGKLYIDKSAKAKSISTAYGKEAEAEENLELFLQDFTVDEDYVGKSVDLVVKDVEFNKSGNAIMIIFDKKIGK